MARLEGLERYRSNSGKAGAAAVANSSGGRGFAQRQGPGTSTAAAPSTSAAQHKQERQQQRGSAQPPAPGPVPPARAVVSGRAESGGAREDTGERLEAQTLRLVSGALERNMARGRNNLALAEKLQVYLGLLQDELRRLRQGDTQLAARILESHRAKTTATAAAAAAAAPQPPPQPQPPSQSSPQQRGLEQGSGSPVTGHRGAVAGTRGERMSERPTSRVVSGVDSTPPTPPAAAHQSTPGAPGSAKPEAPELPAQPGAGGSGAPSAEAPLAGEPGRAGAEPPDRLDGGADIRRVFSRSPLVQLPGDPPGRRGGGDGGSEDVAGVGAVGACSGSRAGSGRGLATTSDAGGDASISAVGAAGSSGGAPPCEDLDSSSNGESSTGTCSSSDEGPVAPALPGVRDDAGFATGHAQHSKQPGPERDAGTGRENGPGPAPLANPVSGSSGANDPDSRVSAKPGGSLSLDAARALAREAEDARAALMGLLSPGGALPGPLEAVREAQHPAAATGADDAPAAGRDAAGSVPAVYALAGDDVPERLTRIAGTRSRTAAAASGAGEVPRTGGNRAGGDDVRTLAVLLYGMVSELRRRGYVGCEDAVEAAAAAVERALHAERSIRGRGANASGLRSG